MDTYPRCATCQHYVPHVGYGMDMATLQRKLGKDGEPLVITFGYGYCDKFLQTDSLLSHEQGYDCSSGCEITVDRDFGCVMYERKE